LAGNNNGRRIVIPEDLRVKKLCNLNVVIFSGLQDCLQESPAEETLREANEIQTYLRRM